MANEKNLKPIRTTERAQELGRLGGVKSGESRRNKKRVRNGLKMLMSELHNIDSQAFAKNVQKLMGQSV